MKLRVKKPPLQHFLHAHDVAWFYHAVRDGQYVGRKREREAIERMFIAADEAGVISMPAKKGKVK